MEIHFDEELKKVRRDILQIVSLVEESITKSLKALKEIDIELAKTIAEIDHQIDSLEIGLEEECIALIASHQPVGSDLRLLIGIIEMNKDLERMGDHAVNIADCIKFLAEHPPIKQVTNIWMMAKIVNEMLKDSVESFINNDPDRAQKVCERDKIVDEMRNETIRIFVTYTLEKPETIGSAIQYILIAKNLERIADLSTNICEDVIYIAQARIIKQHAEIRKDE